jgi:hypothetical protein
MSLRVVAGGLLVGLAMLSAGCTSCCHKWGHGTTASAPPCCPPPAPPPCCPPGGTIPPPPAAVGSNYAPPIVSVPYR